VNLFVLNREIEMKSWSATGRSTRRPSTLNDNILFNLQADHKKNVVCSFRMVDGIFFRQVSSETS
jgi:hypothetical protein